MKTCEAGTHPYRQPRHLDGNSERSQGRGPYPASAAGGVGQKLIGESVCPTRCGVKRKSKRTRKGCAEYCTKRTLSKNLFGDWKLDCCCTYIMPLIRVA